MTVAEWIQRITPGGARRNSTPGFGRPTRGSTTRSRPAVSRPRPAGIVPSHEENLRINAYLEGVRFMRDRLANDLAFYADQAPSKESADYLWSIIMRLKSEIIA